MFTARLPSNNSTTDKYFLKELHLSTEGKVLQLLNVSQDMCNRESR
jgi:hypothetical protein